MIITYHKNFTKKYKRLFLKQKTKLDERIVLFENDEFNSTLNNHALTGRYKGYRSINVAGDLRAVFMRMEKEVIFVDIDSHSNLYG